MPWIIDYDLAAQQLQQKHGLKCNYHNSGAFGFVDGTSVQHLAWIGPEDPTIRPAARPFVRTIQPPYEETLAKLATTLWQRDFPGRIWAMPMSHWAYELNFGSREWMPALLEHIEIDPGLLENRNNAAPIEFAPDEHGHFQHFSQRLLEMLMGSDFMFVHLSHPLLCTLHHHKQLWWSTTDAGILQTLEKAVAG